MNENFKKWLANKKNNILIVNSKTDIKKELLGRKMWGTIHIWIENTNTIFKVLVFKETETYDIYKFEVKEDCFKEIDAYTQVNIKEAIEIIKSDDSNILSIATEL